MLKTPETPETPAELFDILQEKFNWGGSFLTVASELQKNCREKIVDFFRLKITSILAKKQINNSVVIMGPNKQNILTISIDLSDSFSPRNTALSYAIGELRKLGLTMDEDGTSATSMVFTYDLANLSSQD
jgi:hypothetical protein